MREEAFRTIRSEDLQTKTHFEKEEMKVERYYDQKRRFEKISSRGKQQIREGKRLFTTFDLATDDEFEDEAPISFWESKRLANLFSTISHQFNHSNFATKYNLKIHLRRIADYRLLATFLFIFVLFISLLKKV